MSQFFVHNGYAAWSYGTPSDPQLISANDAAKLMKVAGLSVAQVERVIPPAQYAAEGERLFHLTGGNRFLCYSDLNGCFDINQAKASEPLAIDWQVA
ncbi:hypothetical protein [Dyella lutea]|uniref:Uncharacterized protein n=1 Tax=Dyella lutea TaxID=2950441 RepID=A0ABT1FET8_9GAMM|nr:hypothetical protein [Dyella lutea]MCP1375899.1 hypothetical protein [Dyella lutea]